MYSIVERTPDEIAAESLIVVSESRVEKVRFFAPLGREIEIDFGERGVHPLRSGYVHRTVGRHSGDQPGTTISLELFGFDESRSGSPEANVAGIWGPRWHRKEAGRLKHRGSLEDLPEDLVRMAVGLLDGRGGIELDDVAQVSPGV